MLFGGFSEDGSALNNMYVLDTAAWTCCEVNVQGDIPSPRGYHSALLLGKKVYLTSGTKLVIAALLIQEKRNLGTFRISNDSMVHANHSFLGLSCT